MVQPLLLVDELELLHQLIQSDARVQLVNDLDDMTGDDLALEHQILLLLPLVDFLLGEILILQVHPQIAFAGADLEQILDDLCETVSRPPEAQFQRGNEDPQDIKERGIVFHVGIYEILDENHDLVDDILEGDKLRLRDVANLLQFVPLVDLLDLPNFAEASLVHEGEVEQFQETL